VWGLRSRRTLVLDTGLVLAALSLVTLRFYVHLAPLWILLAVPGWALVLLALGLHRWLRRGPGGGRRGRARRGALAGAPEGPRAARGARAHLPRRRGSREL